MHGTLVNAAKERGISSIKSEHFRSGPESLLQHHAAAAAAVSAGYFSDKLAEEDHPYNNLGKWILEPEDKRVPKYTGCP